MRRTRSGAVILCALVSAAFFPGLVSAADVSEQINHLLKFVETSRCTFIRNGSERDSETAARHIKKKYDYFRNDIHSAEDFIEVAAAKSLLTGQPYLVRCAAGQAIPTADWLRAELAAYRKDHK